MIWSFWQVYRWAPLGSLSLGFLPQWRLLGLGLAAIALLAGHLFLQVPLAVLGVLFTSNQEWENTTPLAATELGQLFTLIGLKVNKILPDLVLESEK
jgi:hypothetical protein